MKKLLLLPFFPLFLFAQTPQPRSAYDIQHYRFALTLSDESDQIEGEATVFLVFRQNSRSVDLDLIQANAGKGMRVQKVVFNGRPLPFRHDNNVLTMMLPREIPAGDSARFRVSYRGVPADGLIISRNRYDERTFFGDNWPNRARHWLPTVDHPADKATVEWIVTAPPLYEVVGNGYLIEESLLPDGTKRTHWRSTTVLPTKVMVIGAARFARRILSAPGELPISAWVYPQNRKMGFDEYSRAVPIVQYFTQVVGPFPYAKLANVQSTTRYGGMENASTIFYDQNAISSDHTHEGLIAHEIAHQWFGNTVTEADWPHLWLSEGFATFFENLYMEHAYGDSVGRARRAADCLTVAAFARQFPNRPVVDTTVADPNQLLNPNSYQKGGWVLHMLRRELGDSTFFRGMRSYYANTQFRNADTETFQRVMEEESGKNLANFFEQWIYRPGIPTLTFRHRYDSRSKTLRLMFTQTQSGPAYSLPLRVRFGDQTEIVLLDQKEQSFTFKAARNPASVQLDPGVDVLFVKTIQ